MKYSWNTVGHFGLLLAIAAGCHAKATIATWQPARIDSTPKPSMQQTQRVAFAPIAGPEDVSLRLESALESNLPKSGNHLAVIYPADAPNRRLAANLNPGSSPRETPFRTASHQRSLEDLQSGPTSIQVQQVAGARPEYTPLDAARNRNAGLMVQGAIEFYDFGEAKQEQEGSIKNPNNPGAALAALNKLSRKQNAKDERIIVTWEATDVATGQLVDASTMSLTRSQIEKQHPDLLIIADPVERLLIGVSREAWSQYAPAVQRKEVTLDRPYWSLGSKRVREGNAFAEEGLWQMAEQQWQAAVRSHPKNKSAWHNLAIASVAQEDFEMARLRLSKAKGWIPNEQYEQTELWIDAQQKAYHRALGLPDREGGWLNPDPPMAPANVGSQNVPSVEPVDLEDLPWWTAIPFTKPPGWTWKAWLTQPLH